MRVAIVPESAVQHAGQLLSGINLGRFDFSRRPTVEEKPRPATLAEFVGDAWPVIEPGTPFIDNWHIGAICEHLEAVRRGEIRHLLITMPPGHMKSLTVSVFWPAWMWTEWPEWRLLSGSYGLDLAVRDAVKSREIIGSDWYQSTYRPSWSLSTVQDVKSYYRNTQHGERVAVSVGGKTTGFRGNAVVIDDPLSVMDSYSETKRREVVRWMDQAVSNRLSDMRTGSMILMMQRVHRDDPAGHVLESGDWDHLNLPSEYRAEKAIVTSIGWSDPRSEEGELLFPEMYPKSVLDEQRRKLGSYGYNSQHQQDPQPLEGGMFKRSDFLFVARPDPPPPALRIRRWDMAASAGRGDYTVGLLMAYYNDTFYIEDVVRGQWAPAEKNKIIKQTAALDRATYGTVYQGGPQDPGSAGVDAAAEFIRLLEGHTAYVERETGSKALRARPLAAQVGIQRVALYEAPWNAALLDEFDSFRDDDSGSGHDDQVDAASGAFSMIMRQKDAMVVV